MSLIMIIPIAVFLYLVTCIGILGLARAAAVADRAESEAIRRFDFMRSQAAADEPRLAAGGRGRALPH
jgi:hypothetical protein